MPGETRSRPAFTPSVHAGPSRSSFTLHAASFTPSVHSILQRSRPLFTHSSTRSRAPFTHSVHAFTRSAHPFTRTGTPVRRTGRVVSVIGVQIDSPSARQLAAAAWAGMERDDHGASSRRQAHRETVRAREQTLRAESNGTKSHRERQAGAAG